MCVGLVKYPGQPITPHIHTEHMLPSNCFPFVSQGSKLSAHAVKTCKGECTHHLQSLDGGCSKLPHQQGGL